jgi:hypothetical protein
VYIYTSLASLDRRCVVLQGFTVWCSTTADAEGRRAPLGPLLYYELYYYFFTTRFSTAIGKLSSNAAAARLRLLLI